ncbi:hypothetical protein [Luteimonas suaedae]|uniref:hypothetical protein n=1 Tax=Luteimonas suaedae TaxID=2605430 RepID=UPI001659363F|nr:hypothetical protein [Luteimonas suaedae]
MEHVIAAAADAAFDRYEEASARAARYLTGAQLELFDTVSAEAAEWRGIWLACERERQA